jgi:hypothetical protein
VLVINAAWIVVVVVDRNSIAKLNSGVVRRLDIAVDVTALPRSIEPGCAACFELEIDLWQVMAGLWYRMLARN